MNLEVLPGQIEHIDYPSELEKALGVSEIIGQLELIFNLFLENEKTNKHIEFHTEETDEDPELKLLRLIKVFLHREKTKVKSITQESILSNSDCLTLAVITCLLADRKGYRIKIGRPDQLSRYFHALIVKHDGGMFQIAGKNKTYPSIKVMDTKDVSTRLKTLKPVISFVGSVVKSFKSHS